MAKAENGVLGPVKGKVGNLIFSSWLGTPNVRTNPGTRKKGNEKEVNTRNGFGDSWQYILPIKEYLKLGFREVTRGNRGQFTARQYMLNHAVERDTMNNTSFVPSRMLMSQGSLSPAREATVSLNEAKELLFTWNPSAVSGPYSSKDEVMLLAFNTDQKQAVTSIGEASRRDGSASLSIADLPTGTMHVYLSFLSFDRSKASDSVYLGELEK